METTNQTTLTANQFGAVAPAYLTSAVHAQGADLQRLTELMRRAPHLAALDLGCGAGHAAYALAQGGAEVTAYDVSPEMLGVVEAEALRRGLDKVRVRQGAAENLPFQDASFDFVVTRLSAHHWSNVPAAMNEIARVLKPGGSLIIIDVIAPEIPLFDTVLQTVEILRDASHVRDYRISDWRAMCGAAGFQEPACDTWRIPMEFTSWIARMRTSPLRADAIRDVFAQSPHEVREYFKVRPNGDFEIDVAWVQAMLRV
ncbi:MAG: methyltransferase domain-containing protein [Gallionellaceae bacterium]|jgi:ubiquinone/menaquinone biosynthesis C-methylase UbiE|nr:methyltransferase domain-containing protein [Gallionellaceae bacterium]